MAFSMMGAMGDYMAEKTREIVKIYLDDIKDDANNDFEVTGSEEIEKKNALLKDSIEQFGLLDPLVVRPAGDGKYTLISGHRRKLMHERLVAEGKEEFSKVDCVIINADETDAEQMLLEANLPNRTISDWEKMQAVKRMNDIFRRREEAGEKFKGRRREHIAEALGMSLSAVGRLEKIERGLTEEYKQEYKQGNISTSVADKLAGKSEDEQRHIHATKGTKVKLIDLQDKRPAPAEVPAPVEPPEPAEMPAPDVEEETPLLGIPEKFGEVIVVIGGTGGKYYAGYRGKAHMDGQTFTFENVDKGKTYHSYDEAWDAAIDMADEDEYARWVMNQKEEEEVPPPITQPDEEEPEQSERDTERKGYEIALEAITKVRNDLYDQQRIAIENDNEEALAALNFAVNHINGIVGRLNDILA